MAGMKGDPKNPNSWWGPKLPSREMLSIDLRKIPRKRLYWIVPLVIALGTVEIYFFYMLMK
jgi:hypothetical protein